MKILIVGGSGFVSGELARRAVEAGHEVWAVTRGRRPMPQGVHALTADRSDATAFRNAVRGAEVRWDFAADCICYTPADMERDVEVLTGTASQLLFISTDFVFDPARRVFPQPEESAHYLSEGYGGQKRACELLLARSAPPSLPWTVLRCCHIYGPGSQLGCLPAHSRDPDLIARLKRGEALRLVGGGAYLQQPLFVRDLADLILSAAGRESAYGELYNVAGPEIVESRRYYEDIAAELGVRASFEEIPVERYRAEHPEHASFLCHRIYRLDKLERSGLRVPATPLRAGIAAHVRSLLKS